MAWVAVTDSMLSTPDDRHYPGHQKLFQIDDHTIAIMTGSYSRPGLGGQNQHFDLWVPNTMNKFAARLQVLARSNVSLAFPMKFQRFFELFEGQLTANLQAAILADPALNVAQLERIELTLLSSS
jgi:hypothetical protein